MIVVECTCERGRYIRVHVCVHVLLHTQKHKHKHRLSCTFIKYHAHSQGIMPMINTTDTLLSVFPVSLHSSNKSCMPTVNMLRVGDHATQVTG